MKGAEQMKDYYMPEQLSAEVEADKFITISVAEYHILTKAAAMLEVIISDPSYDHTTVVNAVAEALRDKTEKAGDSQ